MSEEKKPFEIQVRDAELDDLKRRLRATRLPDKETVDDWSQGVPLVITAAFTHLGSGLELLCSHLAEAGSKLVTEALRIRRHLFGAVPGGQNLDM